MNFSLIPFSDHDSPKIAIDGKVNRQNNLLSIQYYISGNVREVVLPPPTQYQARRDELWRRTCFEFFIAVKGLPGYWEFNLSPSGDWNIYAMDAYRQVNMREETRMSGLPFRVQKEVDCISLEVEINLSPIIPVEVPIETGITSVIEENTGKQSYWALIHPHSKADFHLRNSFVVELP